ncbi:hypothetical protein KUF57_20600 [Mycolicibacterium sp. PAM1]|nr:hypothetical protein [Mycolicibacterium sp. PAM1]
MRRPRHRDRRCTAFVTLPRPWPGKLTTMTALGLFAAVSAALWIGYLIGHRRGSRKHSWRERTSRATLGRQAVNLIAMVTLSELERTARKRLPALLHRVAR